MIRLALLDDHPAVLVGLQRLLAPARDMEVLAAAADEVRLAHELDGRRPDVLIVDYDPSRGDALAFCRRVKARPETPRVLIYTAYGSAALAVAARAAQADGLLDKSAPGPTLIAAIRGIADGKRVMPMVSRRDFQAAAARLDEADLPVFAMLLDGAAVPVIAEGLQTDERVAAHRAQKVVARLRPVSIDSNRALVELTARSDHAESHIARRSSWRSGPAGRCAPSATRKSVLSGVIGESSG